MEMKQKPILLPYPQKMEMQEGKIYLSYDSRIVLGTGAQMETAHLLKEEIKVCTGFEAEITKTRTCRAQDVLLELDQNGKEQQYQLMVSKEGIRVSGGDQRGLLYGVQTLRQLLRQSGAALPCLEIEDYPKIPERGFYHDVTRGRIPTLDYLKKLASRMAFYKLNQLQLYVEHSFLFEGMSEVWRDSTPLTAEEILELDEYCRKLGIELVPSVSSFGHLYHLLRTQQFAHLSEMENTRATEFSFIDRMLHHTLDVENPQGMQLVKNMLSEYMELFSSKKFNICADETFDLGKGKNLARAKREGVTGMYMDYVKELCEFVIEKGRVPMFWGDIICGFPEEIKKLPKETICLNWGYAPDQREEETRKLDEAGATQYLCSGAQGWNNWINPLFNGYENIRRMAGYAVKYNAPGFLNTDWGDFGHINQPDFSIPAMIFGAAFSWNTEIPSFEKICEEISILEYRNHSGRVMDLIACIHQYEDFNWWSAVYFKEKYTDQAHQREVFVKYAREKLFEPEVVERDNKKLQELREALAGEMAFTDSACRERLADYSTAIEAICMFNSIGAFLAAHLGSGLSVEERKAANTLANELETWFYYYKKLWRRDSREAELQRVQDVIDWYADLLREMQ